MSVADPDPGVELVVSPIVPVVRAKDRRVLSLSIVPRAGHRLHPSAPVTVRVDGHSVELPRPLFQRSEAVDPRADSPRFEIPVVVANPHTATVRAQCSLWICRGDRCRPVELEAHWTLSPPTDGGVPL